MHKGIARIFVETRRAACRQQQTHPQAHPKDKIIFAALNNVKIYKQDHFRYLSLPTRGTTKQIPDVITVETGRAPCRNQQAQQKTKNNSTYCQTPNCRDAACRVSPANINKYEEHTIENQS